MVSEESAQAFPISAQFGPGSRIAGYLIEEKIGQGGMAVVFRAHDERLDRTVALKLLSPGLAQDDAFRQRFIRESRSAASVDDPHIIPVYDAGEASGGLFIAMRFVRGGDVRSLIDQTGPMPAERAFGIVAQVASALDAAHAKGLVHRDVKPANMLLDRGSADHGADDDRPDHVYLADFGLSKLSLQSTGLTDTGTFLGTLDYVSPEQIEGRPVDGRADQYALACAAFELLTGSTPFRRDERQEMMAVMYAQLSEPPPALSGRRPDLPAAADYVFTRGLAKVPDDRYRTCREFANALGAALGLGQSESPSGRIGRPVTEAVVGVAAPAPAPTGGVATAHPQAAYPVTGPGAVPAGYGAPAPSGGGYSQYGQAQRPTRGQRLTPVLLLVIAIVVSGGIIGGALVFRSHNSPSASSGNNSPGASSSSGNSTPNGSGSTQPQGQGNHSTPTTGNTTPVNQGTTPPTGSAGYKLAGTLSTGSQGLTSVSWNPSGSLIASSDKSGETYLWNVPSGQSAHSPFAGSGQAFSAAISPNGALLAVGYSTGATNLWNLKSGKLITTFQDPGPSAHQEVDSVAFSPDGKTLATGDGNGYVNLWDLSAGTHTSLANPVGVGVLTVAFSSLGALATGDYDGDVAIWDTSSRTETGSFVVPAGSCTADLCDAVSSLAFSRDGSVLAAGTEDGFAELWNVAQATSRSLEVTAPSNQPIWGMSFNGAGLLALADNDGESYLYQVSETSLTASPAGTLADPSSGPQGVGELGFSPDGKYLVTADTNGNAYVWHLR